MSFLLILIIPMVAAGVGLLVSMPAVSSNRLGLAGLALLLSANTLAIAYALAEV
jgi:hypothetical protein